MYSIFVVDDEIELLEVIKSYLEKEEYKVTTFSDAKSALAAVDDDVDLWLLDIMLGAGASGYDIIRKINSSNPKPVIFMSARDQEFDRILGLEMGSEDYITKPFSMREMILRVNNIIKRYAGSQSEALIKYGRYEINEEKRLVTDGEIKISLTSKELDLVLTLLSNKGQSFTRDSLLNKIWGNDYYGSDRVVDDLVKRIRKKMPDLNIETIYGYGYRLT
ncbi:MAG: response regulator transcription factor [Clostridia bacterium]|nr:response regulator transcription factor [Clostridia bacterium]